MTGRLPECGRRYRVALLSVLIAVATPGCDRERDIVLGPGITAPEAPVQREVPERVRDIAGHRLRTRADFAITAKLLSKRRYRWDEMAAVVPWDFALAWGVMSDEALLDGTHLAQGDRRMFWHLYDVPLPKALVERASANVHLIPASERIAEQLEELPTGAVVSLRGELVDLFFPDGRVIPTSMSRFDRGDGACEILYVNEVVHASGAEGWGVVKTATVGGRR